MVGANGYREGVERKGKAPTAIADLVVHLECMLDCVEYLFLSRKVLERIDEVNRTNARDLQWITQRKSGEGVNVSSIVQVLERMGNEGLIKPTNDAEKYIQVYRETNQYSEEELRQFVFYERKKK